jgi:DNA-binding GntR family transcriptional regulator
MTSTRAVTTVLANERRRLARLGTADRVSEILREQIAAGLFPPGTRLSEESIGEALGVSRNTLRESFRLLGHEKLVVHELNRGVFVRVLTAEDVADLFLLRQIIESSALDIAGRAGPLELGPVSAAVEQAEAAAGEGRWDEVATLDLQFHQEIVALAHSPRLDELMHRLLAELRLAFHVMHGSQQFHEPYLMRNRKIVTLLKRKKLDQAARELHAYLDDAQRELLSAFRAEQDQPSKGHVVSDR